MSRQFWSETITWATSNGTAVASSAAETILFPNITIPANYMQDGRALKLTLRGAYGTFTSGTMIFGVRWGGVAGTQLAKSPTFQPTVSVGGGASMTALWEMSLDIQTRSNGSSGTLMTNGSAILYTATAPTAGTVTNYGMAVPIASGATGGTTPVVATVDLTADTALAITVTWSVSNAANSIQGLQYLLESLN